MNSLQIDYHVTKEISFHNCCLHFLNIPKLHTRVGQVQSRLIQKLYTTLNFSTGAGHQMLYEDVSRFLVFLSTWFYDWIKISMMILYKNSLTYSKYNYILILDIRTLYISLEFSQ